MCIRDRSAVASAESGVASAEAQLDAAKDARNGTTLAQVEQGIGSANRGVDSAEVQELSLIHIEMCIRDRCTAGRECGHCAKL